MYVHMGKEHSVTYKASRSWKSGKADARTRYR